MRQIGFTRWRQHPQIQTHHRIGPGAFHGAGALDLARAAWPKLGTLFLRDNEVGDGGAVALAQKPLTLLALESNKVGAATVAALAHRSDVFLSEQR